MFSTFIKIKTKIIRKFQTAAIKYIKSIQLVRVFFKFKKYWKMII